MSSAPQNQIITLRIDKGTSKFTPSLSQSSTNRRKKPTVSATPPDLPENQPPTERPIIHSVDEGTPSLDSSFFNLQTKEPSTSITPTQTHISLIKPAETDSLPKPVTKISKPSSQPVSIPINQSVKEKEIEIEIISGKKRTKSIEKPATGDDSDNDSCYDQMNPMEITDLPMSAFLKNSRKGKRMPRSEHSLFTNSTSTVAQSAKISNIASSQQPQSIENKPTAPKVRIVDGQLVVDEDSLLVRQSATSADTTDFSIVHETSQRITSASFRSKPTNRERWNATDTALFYEALSVCGMDFWLIAELFNGKKTHKQIKNKFMYEEKHNSALVRQALTQRNPLNTEFLALFKSEDQIKKYVQEG